MEDMTTGNPLLVIIRFTLPLLMGNIFQSLYSLVDTIIVGRSLGVSALGAIGAVSSLMFFMQGFILGVASGLSIVLAQRYGAKDEKRIRSSFITSIWIALVIVMLLMLISILFADRFLRGMNIPAELFADGKAYFVTTMIGMIALMYFNLICNVLRSIGDTRHLLVFIVLSQLLNILFDILFILVIPLGVIGVALATAISQMIVAIIAQNYLSKKNPLFHLRKEDLRMNKREILLHFKISLPIGYQNAIISIGSLILQFKLNGLGAAAVEGHSIGQKIEMIATMPLATFGVAIATFVAQNHGAKQPGRIWEGIRKLSALAITYSTVMGGLLFFFGEALAFSLFGTASSESLAYIDFYFKLTAPFYSILSLVFVLRYGLQGMGKAIAPTLAGFMEMIMRTLVPVVFTGSVGFSAIAFSHPLAWIAATLVLIIPIGYMRRDDCSGRLKQFITS
ncbi:MATE family efflux transporter [Trichococcus flocculiformis]